jgi:transposase
MTSPIYVGIDIAKDELVVATTTSILCTVPNDGDGHRQIVKRLRGLENPTVVVESTGCYGRELALAVGAAGFPIAIVQPGRVRHFAKSRGILAKTDAIDARVIAQFGDANRPRCWTAPQAEVARLRALVDRRDQIIAQRLQEQGHLESCPDHAIAREIRRAIARLQKDEQAYTSRITALLNEHERLRRLSEALLAEAGVGVLSPPANPDPLANPNLYELSHSRR